MLGRSVPPCRASTAYSSSPRRFTGRYDDALNVIAAAITADVDKVVYNGVYHPSLSLPNHASTRPVEEALYASHLDFTVLQPAMYVQALEATYHQALDTGRVVAPWSKHSKTTYVDYRDVAEVAALAFTVTRLSYGTFELAAGGMWTGSRSPK